MIKACGIFLAFAASAAIGLAKSAEVKKRRALLLEFREMLLRLSTEMGYFKEPLPQIFRRLARDGESEAVLLLRSCILAYDTQSRDMGAIWKSTVREIYRRQPLMEEDLSVMMKCGDFLGQSDYRGQQEHFQLINMQLDSRIREAEEAVRTKGKLYARMGVSLGLVIAVILA